MSYLTVKDVDSFLKKQYLDKSVKIDAWSSEAVIYSITLDGLNIRWRVVSKNIRGMRNNEKQELITTLVINNEEFKPDRSYYDKALKADENYSTHACSKIMASLIGF